jgi:hypothetical protein
MWKRVPVNFLEIIRDCSTPGITSTENINLMKDTTGSTLAASKNPSMERNTEKSAYHGMSWLSSKIKS